MISTEIRKKISNKLKGIPKSKDAVLKMKRIQNARFSHLYNLSAEEESNLVYDYTVNRLTIKQCCAKYNLSKKVTEKYLRRNGVEIRTNSTSHKKIISTELEEQIVRIYNEGKTLSEVAKQLNITRCCVYETVKKYNCVRPKSYTLRGKPRSEETKRKISIKNKGHKVNLIGQIETKRKNNSFHVSKPEKEMLENLKNKYGEDDVLYHYKDERYPFYCDFYIKSKDLFIELNAHWTHGGRPYDENDESCQEQLKIWLEKAKTSKFYRQAIYIWTESDVKKRKCAKENKLNYLELY